MTLFPDPQAAPPSASHVPVRRVSLIRLSALIAQATSAIGRIAVEGEVHRAQRGRTGRLWFTLRDRASQVSVSVPAARQSRCRVVDGERVCVVGRLDWVNEWGQLLLVADEISPVGEGAVAAAIAEARRRLGADGLLDRERRPIPQLPSAIGVVCGHEAAVRADIESVVAARFPGYPMVWWETTVSGPGAVDNLISAIAELDVDTRVEVIVLARGGGDAAQLLPFSDEAVCRAVCASGTPVVAAIGHDGDRPLLDEVADLRCGTPSLAASAVVPDRAGLTNELVGLAGEASVIVVERLTAAGRRLASVDRIEAARRGVERAVSELERAQARLRLVHPARELMSATARLNHLDWVTPARAQAALAGRRLEAASLRRDALSPAGVLERGYAVVRSSQGLVIRHPDQVLAGDELDIEVAGGHARAVASGLHHG